MVRSWRELDRRNRGARHLGFSNEMRRSTGITGLDCVLWAVFYLKFRGGEGVSECVLHLPPSIVGRS